MQYKIRQKCLNGDNSVKETGRKCGSDWVGWGATVGRGIREGLNEEVDNSTDS